MTVVVVCYVERKEDLLFLFLLLLFDFTSSSLCFAVVVTSSHHHTGAHDISSKRKKKLSERLLFIDKRQFHQNISPRCIPPRFFSPLCRSSPPPPTSTTRPSLFWQLAQPLQSTCNPSTLPLAASGSASPRQRSVPTPLLKEHASHAPTQPTAQSSQARMRRLAASRWTSTFPEAR